MKRESGVALIVSLIIALIVLILISMAIYISTRGTRMAGIEKRYRTALEAAKGAFAETKRILPIIRDNATGSLPSTLVNSNINCLRYKLTTETSQWTDLSSHNCSQLDKEESTNDEDIINHYDLKYSLGDFDIYVKFSNTSKGNTVYRSEKLSLGGTTQRKSAVTPPTVPWLYRIEMVSVHKNNPNSRAHISILYAY